MIIPYEKGTNDSEVNHLLSFDIEHIIELKRLEYNNF